MKILIVHASAGAGHTKAAEALYNGLKKSTNHQVTLIDSLDYTYPLYKKFYRFIYILMVTRMSKLWGFFFATTDEPSLRPLIRVVRRVLHKVHAHKLERFLIAEQFDYIFSTHFMSTEVMGYLKRNDRIKSKTVCCITDFDVHHIWTAEGVDYYTVASDFTKKKLIELGAFENRIFVTGIPTDEKFSSPVDKIALRKIMGLQVDRFTVLVATGSFGMGPIKDIIRALKGYQVLVVCGHNKKLFEELTREKLSDVKVLGLVNNMEALMAVADIMVTKPGGLSIAEALVRHLPMIFFSAIPGQEENNIKVLKVYGIGMSDFNISQMIVQIDKLRDDPDVFLMAQSKTQKLAKPHAVSDITALIK